MAAYWRDEDVHEDPDSSGNFSVSAYAGSDQEEEEEEDEEPEQEQEQDQQELQKEEKRKIDGRGRSTLVPTPGTAKEEELRRRRVSTAQLRGSLAALKRDVASSFRICARDFGVLGKELVTALEVSQRRARVTTQALQHEREARARAQGKLTETRGRLRVVCRVCPRRGRAMANDASGGEPLTVWTDGTGSEADDDSGGGGGEEEEAVGARLHGRTDIAVQVVSPQDIQVQVPLSATQSASSLASTESYGVGSNVTSMTSSSSSSSSSPIKSATKTFSLDRVFAENTSQATLFKDVQPLVTAAVEGDHACIFAYGQTGTGKSSMLHACSEATTDSEDDTGSETETVGRSRGPGRGRGVAARSAETIFALLAAQSHLVSFRVRVQMVEIYNDEMYDLLGSTTASSTIPGKPVDQDTGIGFYQDDDLPKENDGHSGASTTGGAPALVTPFVPASLTSASGAPAFVSPRPMGEIRQGERSMSLRNVAAVAVRSPEEVLAAIARGERNRTVQGAGASVYASPSNSSSSTSSSPPSLPSSSSSSITASELHASRSHCVVLLDIQRRSRIDGQRTSGRLVLVDLAGSERLTITPTSQEAIRNTAFAAHVAAVARREAQHINQSLAAVGDVLTAVAARDKHIPFRNCKLTHLLQDSLGSAPAVNSSSASVPASHALLVVHVSPWRRDAVETVHSLQFASRISQSLPLASSRRNERLELTRLQGVVATQAAQLQALQDKLGAERGLRRKFEKRLEEYRQEEHRRRSRDDDRTTSLHHTPSRKLRQLPLGPSGTHENRKHTGTPIKDVPYATKRWSLQVRRQSIGMGGQENISENIQRVNIRSSLPTMALMSSAEKKKMIGVAGATPMANKRTVRVRTSSSSSTGSGRNKLSTPTRSAKRRTSLAVGARSPGNSLASATPEKASTPHSATKRKKMTTPKEVRSILKKRRVDLDEDGVEVSTAGVGVGSSSALGSTPSYSSTVTKQVSFDLPADVTPIGGEQFLSTTVKHTTIDNDNDANDAPLPRQPTVLLRTSMNAARVPVLPRRVLGSPAGRARIATSPRRLKPKWNGGWR